MGYRLFIVIFFFITGIFKIHAQDDTLSVNNNRQQTESIDTVRTENLRTYTYTRPDSATLARAKHVRDSLTWFYLKPDPNRKNLFVAEMLEKHIVSNPTFLSQPKPKAEKTYGEGKPLPRYFTWELWVLLMMIIAFAVLKKVFGKQMELVFQAFYSDRAFSQINKEENIFSSWYFLFSYILFSLFTGFFIYIFLSRYLSVFVEGSFSLFLMVSLFFAVFLGLKILSLRFLGYFFYSQRLTREYINAIYLSFFNVSLFLLPLIICLTLIVGDNSWILWICMFVVSLALVSQLFRIAVHILGNYKLSKFYLILYLCAFELCPVIIIVKALNI